jgi:Fe2+ or Zn2+ uptake regulation protein
MCQGNVLNIIKESKKRLTAKEILDIYNKKYGEIGASPLGSNLRKLFKNKDIKRKNKGVVYFYYL